MKKSIALILILFSIFISCKSKQRGLEGTTPEPLEDVSALIDGGSAGKYVLTVGKDGIGFIQKLDEDGNIYMETAVTVTLDANNHFDVTAELTDGTSVHITGSVDSDGKIDTITLAVNSVEAEDATLEEQTTTIDAPKWLMVSAFGDHTCAVKNDYTAWCWGEAGPSNDPQLSPAQVSGVSGDISFIKTASMRTCLLTTAKDLWCWGGAEEGFTPQKLSTLSGAVFISLVSDHLFAIRSDKTAFTSSLLVSPPVATDLSYGSLQEIAASQQGFYFIEEDGDLKYAQSVTIDPTQIMANATDLSVYSGETNGISCAIDTSKKIWCWNNNDKTPSELSGISDVVTVAAGGSDRCVIKDDDTLWCSLSQGSTAQKISLNSVKSVSLGQEHYCAIDGNDYLWCWGKNDNGQLGIGSTKEKTVPVKITGQ